MRARWLVNLALLLLVGAIAAFLYFRPAATTQGQKSYQLSVLKVANFTRLSVEFPAKAPVMFEKIDGYWRLTKPYSARADQASVLRILSLAIASSKEKFPTTDLGRFGLDNSVLKLKMNDETFSFGTFNPVTSEQYVAYKDAVYLLPSTYSEAASVQVVELIDKNPLKPTEQIAGFDFARLEQWEDTRLSVDLVNGKWKASVPSAKPDQNQMKEWYGNYWEHNPAQSVEPYTPDRKATYPSFEVKLKDGSKVHFDKLQESPELQLGRPDEGMMYHFPQDVGFSMLNPPVGLAK